MITYPELTDEQKAIILGTALGDGCISLNTKARPGNTTARIMIAQGIDQIDYLTWKREKLYPLITANLTYEISKGNVVNGRFVRPGRAARVKSRQHPFLTYINNMLYNENRKRVFCSEMFDQLTPLSIAVWYMDDGTLSYSAHKNGNQYARLYLSTDAFSLEDNYKIRDYLIKKGFSFKISKHGASYRLTCDVFESIKAFIEMITPYVLLPLFQYKIDLSKDNRSRYTFPCGLRSVFPYFPEEICSQGSPNLETLQCPFLSRGAKKEY